MSTRARHYLSGLEVVAGGARRPPFALDALVMEQDRDLVLDAGADVRAPAAPLAAVVSAMAAHRPPPAGTVLVDGSSRPARVAALVHDFSAEPPFDAAWVAAALEALWSQAAARGWRAVGLPLLGSVHGPLATDEALALLERSLWRARPPRLARLWILVPRADVPRLAARWRGAGCEVVAGAATG